jgi:bifunctional UDP-N-acetylglucosamine pyrophosphorylase/glucosamine-1-phosphate N-acetyltransferase
MNSNNAKSLQKIGGISMLRKICETAGSICSDITLVVGFDKEAVINESNNYGLNISTSEQPNPIGTGDAVKWGLKEVTENSKILVLYGDVPLIKKSTLENLIDEAESSIMKLPKAFKKYYKDITNLKTLLLF